MMMLVLLVKKEKVCVFSVNLSFDKTWQKKNNFSDKWRRKARVQKPVFPTLPNSSKFIGNKKSFTYHFTLEKCGKSHQIALQNQKNMWKQLVTLSAGIVATLTLSGSHFSASFSFLLGKLFHLEGSNGSTAAQTIKFLLSSYQYFLSSFSDFSYSLPAQLNLHLKLCSKWDPMRLTKICI